MPDIVDGTAGLFRGGLGQWIGHSLLGVVLSAPAGFALARLLRRLVRKTLLARLDGDAPRAGGLFREIVSAAIGALSHVASDLISHRRFLVLWPFCHDSRIFPSWWYHAWGSIPLPLYREPYPLAPHTVVWCALTVLGVVLFVRCLRSISGTLDAKSR